METAMPFPRVFVMRVAAADRDRTGEHVTIVDVPAFLTGIGRSAAGESGHPSSNCGIEGVGKPSYSLGSKIGAESLRGGTQGPPEAGVGGEYALMNGWSVKAEYLYVDLGRVSTTSANLTAFTPPIAFPANVFTHFSPETSAIKAPLRQGLFVPRPRECHPRRD
jgi:hypothetical protein